jgi:seryl-tRNA synthetase
VTPGSALLPTSAGGVYLYPGEFEAIVHGLGSAASALSPDPRNSLVSPPVIARSVIERAGYAKSFPHLLGTVLTRSPGGTADEPDIVLLPAACYCVYALYEGARLEAPAELSVGATCFRHEATTEQGRLRSFRMREFVLLGTEEHCRPWRDTRLAAVRDWLASLGLETDRAVASDPFFGSENRLLKALQAEEQLKIELLTEVGDGHVQAVASGNYHKDQFGRVFGISDGSGAVAHTACVALGYERLALALLHRHGPDLRSWPGHVRKTLGLEEALG